MKAAPRAALVLASLLATTALAAEPLVPTEDPTRTQDSEPNYPPGSTHGYENSNPSGSSPDPRLDERDPEEREEHGEFREDDDERQPEQR